MDKSIRHCLALNRSMLQINTSS